MSISSSVDTSTVLQSQTNPHGVETSVWFEYGETEEYGNATQPVSIGSGAGEVMVSETIEGLPNGHFRMVVMNETTTTYSGDHTVGHAIEEIAGANGAISCYPNPVPEGYDSECVVVPDDGFAATDVLVDGVSVWPVGTYTFSDVCETHLIEAIFAPGFEIDVEYSREGTFSCLPNPVSSGSNSICTATPHTGYIIDEIFVDGVSVGNVDSHTFSSVVSDHAIEARYSPIYPLISELTISNGISGYSEIGTPVSINGGRIVAGAPSDDENGDGSGAVYVFGYDESSNKWSEKAKILSSDGVSGDIFGYAAAISGDKIVVGAFQDDDKGNGSGSVYVFDYSAETDQWIESAKLTASDGAEGDHFGRSVAISDGKIVVGAYDNDDKGSESGSIYVFAFDHENGIWIEEAKLLASDGRSYDCFGTSVSIDGGMIVAGAKGNDDQGYSSGSAYVFGYNELTGTWLEIAKLVAPDGSPEDFFGSSVAINGVNIVVGANSNDEDENGYAYVYQYDAESGDVLEVAKLTASDGEAEDRFGYRVDISGDRIVIGAIFDDDCGSTSGSAYVYEYRSLSSTWIEATKLVVEDGAPGDRFGYSVSLDNEKIIAGAPYHGKHGARRFWQSRAFRFGL